MSVSDMVKRIKLFRNNKFFHLYIMFMKQAGLSVKREEPVSNVTLKNVKSHWSLIFQLACKLCNKHTINVIYVSGKWIVAHFMQNQLFLTQNNFVFCSVRGLVDNLCLYKKRRWYIIHFSQNYVMANYIITVYTVM